MNSLSLNAAIALLKADFERNIRGFSLEYQEHCGKRMGSAFEWETRLSIQGRGKASLFRRRSPGDSSLVSPGRYTGQISDAGIHAFLDALDDSGIQDYRSDVPGPRDPVSKLDVVIDEKVFSFSWGISKQAPPRAVSKLKALLTQWTFDACPSAIWNLVLTAHSLQYRQNSLSAQIRLENRGTEEIHIVHPASPGLGSIFGLTVEYGEAMLIEEGFTPEPIDLKKASYQAPALQRLEIMALLPGCPLVFDFASKLEGHAPIGWIGRFSFLHYLLQDTLAGLPVFNGALTTEEYSW